MRTADYVDVIEEQVVPNMLVLDCHSFLQDGASCHRSKDSMAALQANDIIVLEWPGNSPDLNPIENLWWVMKRKLRYMDCTTRENLTANIQKVWLEIGQDYCLKLAESMPKRIADCIKYNGGSTKY